MLPSTVILLYMVYICFVKYTCYFILHKLCTCFVNTQIAACSHFKCPLIKKFHVMTSELWLWMTPLPFCFSASFSASPSTCPWSDSSFHLLFSRHRLCPEGAYRTWNISQNATFKLQRGAELSSSLVTHVCWSVPSLPLGKSMRDVPFTTGRWVGKRRFEQEIRRGDWVWQATMVRCIDFCIWDSVAAALTGRGLGPGHTLSQAGLLWSVEVLLLCLTYFNNF